MVDPHSIAKREMAREKARIHRKKIKQVSFLEQEALKWKRQKEKELIKNEAEKGFETEETISLQKVSTPFKPEEKKEVEPAGWVQYNPWKKDKEEKKERQVSAATIWCLAKKLIAKEWARARGIKTRDPRLYSLARQAARWKKKKEEEERRKKEENKSIQRQKELLDRSLQVFGEKLLRTKEKTSPELATKLLEDSLGEVGEVIDVNWTGNKCDIWIEPWEEKRLRNLRRRGRPPLVTYKVTAEVNDGKVSGKIVVFEWSKPLGQKINPKGGK